MLWEEHGLITRNHEWSIAEGRKVDTHNYKSKLTEILKNGAKPLDEDINLELLEIYEVQETPKETHLLSWALSFPVEIETFMLRCVQNGEFDYNTLSLSKANIYEHPITKQGFSIRDTLELFDFKFDTFQREVHVRKLLNGFEGFMKRFSKSEWNNALALNSFFCKISRLYNDYSAADLDPETSFGSGAILLKYYEQDCFNQIGIQEDIAREILEKLTFKHLEMLYLKLLEFYKFNVTSSFSS